MSKKRVAYLIGAGGTHASIQSVDASFGLLMSDLENDIQQEVHAMAASDSKFKPLNKVVNELVEGTVDIEQVITFLDESPTFIHRQFAEELRHVFEIVFRKRLLAIEEHVGQDRLNLYSAFIDMHNTEDVAENVSGILTLNYDSYIEDAACQIFEGMSHSVNEKGHELCTRFINGWRLLKLHGSFDWEDSWPVRRRELISDSKPLWIPPGIRKETERYPFSLVWGLAREILDCDVLRVIGCRLGPSEWHLISLLFGTRHANTEIDRPYSIEIIDSPDRANALKRAHPYLEVQSIFEIETMDVGLSFVSDYRSDGAVRFDSLTKDEQEQLIKKSDNSSENWFKKWLEKMGEGLFSIRREKSIETPTNIFRNWFEQ